MPTVEELQQELKELEQKKDTIISEYKRIQTEGFNKHKDCCSDICSEINSQIKKLSDVREDLLRKKESSSVKTHRLINKAIESSEEQEKSLKELRSKLYAKAICNCEG